MKLLSFLPFRADKPAVPVTVNFRKFEKLNLTMLKDKFGRIHDYLRISFTDRCNYRCLYCLPSPEFSDGCKSPASDRMTAREIVDIASVFVAEGVNKIRITGGEPLVRKDAGSIIRELGKLPVKLAITTNGSRIHLFTSDFVKAGIRSVNVSLDSLNRATFYSITQKDEFPEVYKNINRLLDLNFHVKVNMVVMSGVNDDEVNRFVEWTRLTPVHVRFIEFMPFPGNRWQPGKVIKYKEIIEKIESGFDSVEKLTDHPNDTTKKYRIKNFAGTFSVISTMSEPFCSGCNRLRLTADGKMRNCLFARNETDILTPFRSGADIVPLIRDTLSAKHLMLGGNTGENWGLDSTQSHNRSMMGIGG